MTQPTLSPGEHVLFQCHPGSWADPLARVLTFDTYEAQRRRIWFTVTTQRVILTRRSSRREHAIPAADVQDVKARVKNRAARVIVRSAGRRARLKFAPLPPREADLLVAAVWQAKSAAASSQPGMPVQGAQIDRTG